MNTKIKKTSLLNKKGQGLIEYLMLVSLLAVATLGVVRVVGHNLSKKYENINRALGASKKTELKAENAPDSFIEQKDLSNFLDGARKSD